ncbi:MAG TPA: hypothetical protein VFH43_07310 [Candidatus Kapabacteria bacterium]|nr:hypothetical protein [Candidatus Kapabacteria bacterium]
MPRLLFASGLLLLLTNSSCTPPQVAIRYTCDGGFTISEDVRDITGFTSVTPGRNVRPDARITTASTDTTLFGGTIYVSGMMTDACENASISYSRPDGSGVTVNLEPVALRATAPATEYAGPDGKFRYDVTVDCCPRSTGKNHAVTIAISTTIAAASISKTQVRCIDNAPIVVEGKMAGHGSGTVTITIDDGAGHVCRLVTHIARDH